jgi:hypothetical protein
VGVMSLGIEYILAETRKTGQTPGEWVVSGKTSGGLTDVSDTGAESRTNYEFQ